MIPVEPGDLIGIHYTDTDGLGVVPYEDSNKASTTGFTNDQLSRIFNAELDDSNLPVRVTKTVPGNVANIKRLPALKPITMIGVYWENYLISCTICTSFAALFFVVVMLWTPIGFMGFFLPIPWWRHDMEVLSALLTLCDGNPSVTNQKGSVMQASMFSLTCWHNPKQTIWINSGMAGHLRRHDAHVMSP